MKPVRFLQSAREDIRREKSWYRNINPEFARRFQTAEEVAVKGIASQPLAMQVLEHEVRLWPLETFRHGVLYRDENEFILVLAVFHPNQATEKWQERART